MFITAQCEIFSYVSIYYFIIWFFFLSRRKGVFTRDKVKMFLKISCERSTPHSEDGIYIVQVRYLTWWCIKISQNNFGCFLLFVTFYTLPACLPIVFLENISAEVWFGWTRHSAEACLSSKGQETKEKKYLSHCARWRGWAS